MTTLLNRVCTLCETETWLEDGFVQCDCIKVSEYDWANGVLETPLCWNDDVDALMHYRQKHYEGMIDRQSDTIVELNKKIYELEQECKEYEATIFDLRGEGYEYRQQVARLHEEIEMWRRRYNNQEKQVDFLLARVANLEKMITRNA